MSQLTYYHFIFFLLVLIILLQRGYELIISKRNENYLLENGGIEKFPKHYFFMKLMHTFWFVACLVEAGLNGSVPNRYQVFICVLVLIIGQTLRLITIKTLKERWCTKIIVLPGKKRISTGIFRYLKHPNYLGVILEIVALPLLFNCYITAIVFTILNAIILIIRITAEEKALEIVDG